MYIIILLKIYGLIGDSRVIQTYDAQMQYSLCVRCKSKKIYILNLLKQQGQSVIRIRHKRPLLVGHCCAAVSGQCVSVIQLGYGRGF